MKNEKLVYSTPSIKIELVDEDILTFSPQDSDLLPEMTLPQDQQ